MFSKKKKEETEFEKDVQYAICAEMVRDAIKHLETSKFLNGRRLNIKVELSECAIKELSRQLYLSDGSREFTLLVDGLDP